MVTAIIDNVLWPLISYRSYRGERIRRRGERGSDHGLQERETRQIRNRKIDTNTAAIIGEFTFQIKITMD